MKTNTTASRNPKVAVVQEIQARYGKDGNIPWAEVMEDPKYRTALEWDDSSHLERKRSMARVSYFLKVANKLGRVRGTPEPATNGHSPEEQPVQRRKKKDAIEIQVNHCPHCGTNIELVRRAMLMAAKLQLKLS